MNTLHSAILDACAFVRLSVPVNLGAPAPWREWANALAALAAALVAAAADATPQTASAAARCLAGYAAALEQLAPHLGADLDAGTREAAGEARAHADAIRATLTPVEAL